MIKFYTPKQWNSFFPGDAELVVDGNGYIYDNYDAFFPDPIGRIDWSTGKIYGEDYGKLVPNPIGKIEQKDDVQVIYGADYDKLFADPILYIVDEKVYSYDEYHKFFSSPDGYIVNSNKEKKSSETINESLKVKEVEQNKETGGHGENSSSIKSFDFSDANIIIVLIIIACVVAGFGHSKRLFFGELENPSPVNLAYYAWIALIGSAAITFVIGKATYFSYCVPNIFISHISLNLLFSIMMMLGDRDESFLWVIPLIIMNIFVMVLPAVIAGTSVTILKMALGIDTSKINAKYAVSGIVLACFLAFFVVLMK